MADRPAYLPTAIQEWLTPTPKVDPEPEERVERQLPPPRPFYTPDKPPSPEEIPTHALIALDPEALEVSIVAPVLAKSLSISSVHAAQRIADGCGILMETNDQQAALDLQTLLTEKGQVTAVVALPDFGALRRPFTFHRGHIQSGTLILTRDEEERRVPITEIQAVVCGHVRGNVAREPVAQCHIVSIEHDLLAIGQGDDYADRHFMNIGDFAAKLATANEGIKGITSLVAHSQKAFDQHRRWAMLRAQVR